MSGFKHVQFHRPDRCCIRCHETAMADADIARREAAFKVEMELQNITLDEPWKPRYDIKGRRVH